MNLTDAQADFIERTIRKCGARPEAVIPILQAVQEEFGYLPEPVLRRLCQRTEIKPAAIAGVSTFYDMFRHRPAGKFLVRVCRGTACHVAGAERIEEALRRELKIDAAADTDAAGQFTVERVACLGCCTLAPVVRIAQSTFGHVCAEKAFQPIQEFLSGLSAASPAAPLPAANGCATSAPAPVQIRIGLGSCCMAKGSDRLFAALRTEALRSRAPVQIKRVGCVGMCHRTPLVEVKQDEARQFYSGLNSALAGDVVARCVPARSFPERLGQFWKRAANSFLFENGQADVRACGLSRSDADMRAFLEKQVHIATEFFGELDPLDLTEYQAHAGFAALRQCLQTLSPEQVIETVERSGLRGRGGAGFPTGPKWRVARQQSPPDKFVICNGDEGDPGAFMDRMILESFPYRVIEGLAIAAYAVGARQGVFYIRHEYPLAVERVSLAVAECERRGWLGENILGKDFSLRLTIQEGAGAFVCGEETALLASIEGKRGMPRLRPPFPAQSGLWGKPTVINNVETLASIPWILRNGAEKFAAYGTASSKGAKVFALAGKVRRGGLIEVPMGLTLREIVEEIGGGVGPGRKFKAVQMGGPSGGCIPARLADTPVDYESLRGVGAIMGSGGMVVLDDTDCMVDIARYFLRFTQDQSCGKCSFCRIGTKRMLDILERLCQGQGQPSDLASLEQLGRWVSQGSLCGLGKTAPNPVLSTLRYFRDEYEAHLKGRCPARKCRALIRYRVLDHCIGCTLCAQACPVRAIAGAPYQLHQIDPAVCTRCDSCRRVCPRNAIEVA